MATSSSTRVKARFLLMPGFHLRSLLQRAFEGARLLALLLWCQRAAGPIAAQRRRHRLGKRGPLAAVDLPGDGFDRVTIAPFDDAVGNGILDSVAREMRQLPRQRVLAF